MDTKGDNLTKLKEAIEEMTGEEPKIIAVPSELIHFAGKTQKAVFLAQIIYWSDRGKRTDKFFYKTRKEWLSETGLSESQVEAYTKEFKKLGILETKVKKANGNPTVHYKFEMEVFLKSFKEFSASRMIQNRENNFKEIHVSFEDVFDIGIPEKSENEMAENGKSLTENTTEISTDILSSTRNSDEFQDKFHKQENGSFDYELDRTEETNSLNIENESQEKFTDHKENKILLPDSFSPSLDLQYQAILNFPNKSSVLLTQKFFKHYKWNRMKKTLAEWQQKWWEWLVQERPAYDYEIGLEIEHTEIQSKVRNQLYRLSWKLNYVFHRDDFYKLAGKEYSEETIKHCLNWLVESKNFCCFENDYFFNLQEYLASEDWRRKVDEKVNILKKSFVATNNSISDVFEF